MKRLLSLCLLSCLAANAAHAAMVTKNLDYDVGGKKMQSVLVYDDAVKTPRPGVVMTPDWLGITPDNLALAKQIAGKDYVLLVADVYGADVRPKNAEEAGAATKAMYANRGDLRARINAALTQLKAQAGKAPLDGKDWGAIGFCFGGATTLDLVRSGGDVAAVVSFHGNLATDDPALAKNIKAKVLALNGGDDKFVSQESIVAFEKEMRDAKVDWQFVNYGGAVHCFAVPSAKGDVPGCQYDERTAKRAYARMHEFFDDAFKAK
ncbi:MAG: dienelactone hydrolase family protein [Rudaea sp.]|uniref:dienelactone hydrolase family protein n=1 Tax=unclassified Rudaea TaxID=2627037 RepID=UPI0010F46ED5|nr:MULTISPECIES: dienelactone hydrolase family protein [unclassified Rudaea]MBN8884289.1 dienelactone hydrolase family protein [Rudaea sp.]MBR0345298.1 dienelactone hydrolase family protein [Rudaea sp.]